MPVGSLGLTCTLLATRRAAEDASPADLIIFRITMARDSIIANCHLPYFRFRLFRLW